MKKPDWMIEVEAVNGPCWVATGGGDPERTHDIEHAERYSTEREATENAAAFRSKYPARKFRVVQAPDETPNAPHEGPGGFSPGPLDAVVGPRGPKEE